jgi:hypothetical protein
MRPTNTNSQRETDTKTGSTLCNKEMKNQQNQNYDFFFPFRTGISFTRKKEKKRKLVSLLDSTRQTNNNNKQINEKTSRFTKLYRHAE